MNKEYFIEKIKAICDEPEVSPVMEYSVDSAVEIIKNYCNIEELPNEIEAVILDLSIDIFKKENSKDYGQLRSITEGEVSMTFGETEKYGSEYLKNYENRLKPFRRIKW